MTSIDLDQPLITPPSMARSNPNSKSDSSQNPIPIPAPGDKNKVEMKPLKLTKKVRASLFV